MSSRSSSLNVSNMQLDQCLENLKHSILQVVYHEQVSDEVRSFLTELVQAILNSAELASSYRSASHGELAARRQDTDVTGTRPFHGELDVSKSAYSPRLGPQDQAEPYQIEMSSQTGSILVTNTATGKVLTLSQEDLIRWAQKEEIGAAER